MVMHAKSGGNIEIMGLLLGKVDMNLRCEVWSTIVLIYVVYLVYIVYFVYLVYLVYIVYIVYLVLEI